MHTSMLHTKQTSDINRQYNLYINSYPASLPLIIHADLREFVTWIWAQLLLATAIYQQRLHESEYTNDRRTE